MKSAPHGFTLVELLIVVSVIAIITGSILPSFSAYITNQNLKQAQEQIKDDLRSLQNRALSGDNGTTQLNGVTVAHWAAEFVPGASTYQFFISTDTTSCGNSAAASRRNMKTSNKLPGDNVIRGSSTLCVFFSFKNGDAAFSPAGASTQVYVGQSSGSACRDTRIMRNGKIDFTVQGELACPS